MPKLALSPDARIRPPRRVRNMCARWFVIFAGLSFRRFGEAGGILTPMFESLIRSCWSMWRVCLFTAVSCAFVGCGPEPKPDPPPVANVIGKAATPVTPASPPTPPPPKVKVSDLVPYFQGEALEAAVADFQSGRNAAAAKAFEGAAKTLEDPDAKRAATFMSLLARHDAGQCDPAVAQLEKMAVDWPLMASYAWFYAGSCHLKEGRADEARKAFSEVPQDSPLAPRAGDKLAESWLALSRPDRAIAALEATVKRHPNARAATWFELIELKKASGDTAGVTHARRELATRMPRSVEGRAARKALGKDHGLTPAQLFSIAMSSYRAQSHRKALKGLQAVLDATDPSSELHCEARVKMARTYENMKKRSVAWRHFVKALGCTGEPLADATFAGGRNRWRAEKYESAIKLLTRHLNAFPTRSTADDARVMIAKSQRAMGDDATADATLLETLRLHPDGDLVDEASWSLLWPLIERKRWRAAVKTADTILTHVPRERSYRAEGRTLYWRARSLQRLRRHDEAMAGYRATLTEYPLSWYALMAHERIKGYGEEEEHAAITEAKKRAAPPSSPLVGIPDSLWSNGAFRRGVELARMGLTSSARRELQSVEIDRRGAAEGGSDDGVSSEVLVWTKIALYEMAEAHDLATHLARGQEPSFGAHWPVGEHKRLWELAHQRGFSELVTGWSKTRGIDPAWVYAIIREESGFNPKIESWANAIGLMQIIMPTAKGLAKGTTLKPTASSLRRPEVSIELGTKFLQSLLERHPVLPLASAGYNAGGGAVSKWRKAMGSLPLDEFVEKIPYKEARGYAKRVTRSVARYRWLDNDGELLALPLSPPGRP